jgi:hypothetical protein
MKGFARLFVVAVTTMTLLLLAAVGAGAASGKLGSDRAVAAVVSVVAKTGDVSDSNNGKHKGECHPPGLSKHHHKHGTPGHKNHPCGEDGDDSD